MLWHIELKFCIWLCFTVLQIKFECLQFASNFVGVMPFWNLEYWKYTVFRPFLLYPLTYLSWKFAYYFVFLYYRSSFSVFNLCLFWSYCLFSNLEYCNFEFQIEKYQSRVGWINKSQPRRQPRLGCWSIPPETDIFLSGTQNLRLIIFLAPTSICLRLKKPPDLFRNQLTSQITLLQRHKPEM